MLQYILYSTQASCFRVRRRPFGKSLNKEKLLKIVYRAGLSWLKQSINWGKNKQNLYATVVVPSQNWLVYFVSLLVMAKDKHIICSSLLYFAKVILLMEQICRKISLNSGHNLLALNKVHFRNTIRLHKLSSLEDSPRKSIFYQIPFYDYVIVSFHQICKLNCHKASECCSTNIKEQLMSHKSVWRLNRFKTFKKFWATNLKKFIKRQW